ncbi:unnamed protein product, partial [Chrysoparadoxa australica]
QKIAAENNVAETAFLVAGKAGHWQLRWFTPAVEVPLCGHATLAAAHYLYHQGGYTGATITFETRQSGTLSVSKLADGQLEMDFPVAQIRPAVVDDDIAAALGARPKAGWTGSLYCALYETVEQVHALKPDYRRLARLGVSEGGWGIGNFGCLALGGPDGVDATSRFFAPGSGIDEDPATGAWHTMVAPLLAELTGKTAFDCYQAYPGRGAHIGVELSGERVKLRGHAVTVIEGQFAL